MKQYLRGGGGVGEHAINVQGHDPLHRRHATSRKSTPPQIRQLTILIINSKLKDDDFEGESTFKNLSTNTLCEIPWGRRRGRRACQQCEGSLASFRKSTPPQTRQLHIPMSHSKQSVDDFVGKLTF